MCQTYGHFQRGESNKSNNSMKDRGMTINLELSESSRKLPCRSAKISLFPQTKNVCYECNSEVKCW